MSVAPPEARCRPQHQQVQHLETVPQPIPRKQRSHQPPPRERTQQPVPQHASIQKHTTVTAKKWKHKSSAHNQHLSQPVLNHPQKDRQLPKRFKQAKDHIVSSRQNHRSVQQFGRFAKQKRDQTRRLEAGSQQYPLHKVKEALTHIHKRHICCIILSSTIREASCHPHHNP